MADKVRFGIVGLGNMGSAHAHYMNKVEGAVLGALCDLDAAKREKFAALHGVPVFATHQEMLSSGLIDAILIAVPHYDHVPIAKDAFAKGVHVLCEKPVSVTVGAAREINEVYKKYPHLKFGIMFNQRTNPVYRKMRDLIADGELGPITRISWLITDWFRTWTYYASGGWRATWKGEGGGVLINQCPHNLDLLQWIVGGKTPCRVTAVTSIAKTHPIEVEDEVSAILEYADGCIGHFVTSTGEAPGTNRLEIVGDKGKLISEFGKLTFVRNRKSTQDVNQNSKDAFTSIENWTIEIPIHWPAPGSPGEHQRVTQQFVRGILKGEPLVGEGTDGIKGLEIGNAMLMAGITRKPVDLPMDAAAFDAFLQELTVKYGGKKTLAAREASVDMAASFK